MYREKMTPFPFTRLLLNAIPGEVGARVLGINIKTFRQRQKKPETVTLGELRRLVKYQSETGVAPIALIRKLLKEDLSL